MECNELLERLRLAKGLEKFHESFFSRLIQCQYKFTEEAFNNIDRFAFIDYYIPSEIFFAMDLIPVMSEHSVNFLASLGLVDKLLLDANNELNDSGTCSFHKPIIPAFKGGLFPKPKIFATTTLCGESSKCFSMTADSIGTNYYSIDLPYSHDKEAIMYVRNQYVEFAKCLEKITGHKFDIDKLREVIKKSNTMRDYLVKGNELRKKGKALLYGSRMLRFGGSFCYHGTDEAIDIAKNYYEVLKERVDKGITPVKKEEHRILWIHLRPFYTNSFFDYMERELRMVIAYEETNHVFWRRMCEEDPFLGLATKSMDWLYAGDINRRISCIKEIIKDYRIDGVINFAHVNCRLLNPKQIFIKNEVDKMNIPQLELSGDCIDRNNFSEKQLLTRIEAFRELLNS